MQIPGWLQTASVPSSVPAGCHGTVQTLQTRSPQTIWKQHGQYRQLPTICPVFFCNDFSITLSWVNNYSQHATIKTNTKKFHVRIGRNLILAKSPYISVILFSSLKLINIKYVFLENQPLRRHK